MVLSCRKSFSCRAWRWRALVVSQPRAARNEEAIMQAESWGTPHLVVLAPESDRGRRIPLDKDYLVVGRERTCDVRFDDPCVSRTQAVLRRRGNAVYVEDLGSAAGTFVNGEAAAPARELHTGDTVTFATVEARLEPGGSSADQTRTMSARPAGLAWFSTSTSRTPTISTTTSASTTGTFRTSTSSARTSSARSPRPGRRRGGSPGPASCCSWWASASSPPAT